MAEDTRDIDTQSYSLSSSSGSSSDDISSEFVSDKKRSLDAPNDETSKVAKPKRKGLTCPECGEKGDLLAECTSCSDRYHLRCTSNPRLTKDTYKEAMIAGWLCSDCKEHYCDVCMKAEPIDSDDLKFCGRCESFFHLACLEPCDHKPKENIPSKSSSESSESAEDEDWVCNDCLREEKNWEYVEDLSPISAIFDRREGTYNSQPTFEYLVKWIGRSYVRCSWIPEHRVKIHNPQRFTSFINMLEHEPEKLKEGLETLARLKVVSHILSYDNQLYLVKWLNQSYEDTTWEPEALIKDLEGGADGLANFYKLSETNEQRRNMVEATLTEPPSEDIRKREFKLPELSGKLYPFQIQGLKFLHASWAAKNNAILADDTGLGKKLQVITHFLSLREINGSNSLFKPFLVLSQSPAKWLKEFHKWAPNLHVIDYTATKEGREIIRDYEFWPSYFPGGLSSSKGRDKSKQSVPQFDVLVTSFGICAQDCAHLKAINWESVVLDSGDSMKSQSTVYHKLLSCKFDHKIVLCGGIENFSARTSLALLEFLELPSFERKKFCTDHPDEKDQIAAAQALLAPITLRRTNAEVKDELPLASLEKIKVLLPVGVTPLQRKCYRDILLKFCKDLAPGTKQLNAQRLVNLFTALQKCVNHPYLYSSAYEPKTKDKDEEQRGLISASGKLALLDKMLQSLAQQATTKPHTLAIFSHQTVFLDIIEDYLDNKEWEYIRLDAATPEDVELDMNLAQERLKPPKLEENSEGGSDQGGLVIHLISGQIRFITQPDTIVLCDFGFDLEVDNQVIRWSDNSEAEERVVQLYQMVCPNTLEEGLLTAPESMAISTLFEKRPNSAAISTTDLRSLLAAGSDKMFQDIDEELEYTIASYKDDTIAAIMSPITKLRSHLQAWGPYHIHTMKQWQPNEFKAVDSTWWSDLLINRKKQKQTQKQKDKEENFGRGQRNRGKSVDYQSFFHKSTRKAKGEVKDEEPTTTEAVEVKTESEGDSKNKKTNVKSKKVAEKSKKKNQDKEPKKKSTKKNKPDEAVAKKPRSPIKAGSRAKPKTKDKEHGKSKTPNVDSKLASPKKRTRDEDAATLKEEENPSKKR